MQKRELGKSGLEVSAIDIEFTVQKGELFILSDWKRASARNCAAAIVGWLIVHLRGMSFAMVIRSDKPSSVSAHRLMVPIAWELKRHGSQR